MNGKYNRVVTVGVAVLTLATASCTEDDPLAPIVEEGAALLSLVPSGGSMDVAVGSNVVVSFDHAIGVGMEAYAALHEGSVTGPEVAGEWTLSEDRTVLTFMPSAPLARATTFVVHLGGGMVDEHGNAVDMDRHGSSMGGQWATGTMMAGGMQQGGGMGPTGGMMGMGWQHPSNGSYGMLFSFTTES